MAAPTLFIATTARDVEDFAAGQGEGERLVVATPEAEDAAMARGVSCHSIEEFSDERAIQDAGEANSGRTRALCALIDHILQDHLEDGERALYSSYYEYFRLKRCLDHVWHWNLVASGLLKALQPTGLVWRTETEREPDDDWAFPVHSLLRSTLRLLAEHHGIAIRELPPTATAATAPGFGKRLRKMATGLSRASREVLTVARAGHPSVILCNGASLDDVLAKHGYRCHRPAPVRAVEPTPRWQSLWTKLAENPAFRAAWLIPPLHLDAFPLVEAQLRRWATCLLPSLIAAAQTNHDRIRRHPPHFALGAAPVTTEAIAAFAAARAAGIPTFSLQHGGFNGYMDFPILRYTDLCLPSRSLVWGEGCARRILDDWNNEPDDAGPGPSKPVIVDSPMVRAILDQRRQPPGNSAPRILYILNCFNGEKRYLSKHHYPDLWYWGLQKTILQGLLAKPGWRITVRPHPDESWGKNPLEEWCLRHGHDVAFDREGNLPARLHDFDLVVLDMPTTGVLQAIATGTAVLVHADRRFTRMDPAARELLAARATVTTDDTELAAALAGGSRLLHCPRPIDDRFLHRFALATDEAGKPVAVMDRILADLSEGGYPSRRETDSRRR